MKLTESLMVFFGFMLLYRTFAGECMITISIIFKEKEFLRKSNFNYLASAIICSGFTKL